MPGSMTVSTSSLSSRPASRPQQQDTRPKLGGKSNTNKFQRLYWNLNIIFCHFNITCDHFVITCDHSQKNGGQAFLGREPSHSAHWQYHWWRDNNDAIVFMTSDIFKVKISGCQRYLWPVTKPSLSDPCFFYEIGLKM